ncbi:hypothetical protein ACFLTK_02805 [Chloroflexota bacterium]
MEIIDFHTHFIPSSELNPHMVKFFEYANPKFLTKAHELEDPRVTAELFKSQGIKYAVVLAEESPATTYNLSNEDLFEHCKGQDIFIPFTSVNPNSYSEPVERLTQ